MNAFTIKDLENLSGIKAHTIRIWEQRYNFIKPNRTGTNIRYYTNEELKIILNIALLNKYGFKISHIDKMSEQELQQKILSLSPSAAQQEHIINELVHCMVSVDIFRFENILDKYVRTKSIETTITNIIFPFLEKIGILWLTNHINPAQEHLITNVIRQKLIAGIESISVKLKTNKTFLLFLPEGEHHELGLLFTHYLMKSRGNNVIYVGANVPLKDIEFVAKLKRPDYLYTHLTTVSNNFNFEKFLSMFSTQLPDATLMISGLLSQNKYEKLPKNVQLLRSLPEVLDFITSLHD